MFVPYYRISLNNTRKHIRVVANCMTLQYRDNNQERDLAIALSKGSQEAFREIFMRYFPKIKIFCLKILGAEEDAEDMAQEIFIKIWNERDHFSNVLNLNAYLFRLSRNLLYDFQTEKQRKSQHNVDWEVDEIDSISPQEVLEEKDLRTIVNFHVEHMPQQRRTIYRLSREQGLSNAEIAERIGITKKSVENHLNLALKELRKALLCMLLYGDLSGFF